MSYDLLRKVMKQKDILETVAAHGILSFTEIMSKCQSLVGLTVPKVRPLVESLVREGELIETQTKKTMRSTTISRLRIDCADQ